MLKDMCGQRIGSLVLDTELPADDNRRRRWLCQCDCGGQIIINSAQLRRGKPDNCGCQRSVMRTDLTGQTFGRLYVLGPSDQRAPRGRRTVPLWECRCQCGEICYKATDTLTNPEESMCAKCAGLVHAERARAKAGFVDGTQISKLRSTKPNEGSKSGIRGVRFHMRDNLWQAHIGFKGQKINLGYYQSLAEAVKARQRAEEEYYERFLEEYRTSNG